MTNGEKSWTEYLGDGVYATYDDVGGIWLRANDHLNPTDQIYLEPAVFESLKRFKKFCDYKRLLRFEGDDEK